MAVIEKFYNYKKVCNYSKMLNKGQEEKKNN